MRYEIVYLKDGMSVLNFFKVQINPRQLRYLKEKGVYMSQLLVLSII